VDEGGVTLDRVVDVPLSEGGRGSAVVSGLPIEAAFGDGRASGVGSAELGQLLLPYAAELVEFRRDLHAHPELGRAEVRTTAQVRERLTRAGLSPVMLPGGTGLLCDIGDGDRLVALRPDLALLPINGRDWFRERLGIIGNTDAREAADLGHAPGCSGR